MRIASGPRARLVAAVIEHVRFRDEDDVREAMALRRRSEIAAVATELLFSSLDWATTLENVARVALPTLADLCVVSLCDESGALERMSAAHVDLDEQARLIRHVSSTPPSPLEYVVMATRRRELRADLERGTNGDVDQALRDVFGVRSVLVLPLYVGERGFGVITFCAAEPGRCFGEADLAIGEIIATRAAQAIEHARLYHRMQQAARARDECLAIASHDLRNLISIVKMSSSFLLQSAPNEDLRSARKQIESIHRAAERMQQLVRDLLDGASVEAGKFIVRRSPQDVRALLQEVTSSLKQMADDRRLRLEVELPPEPLEVLCDPTRIGQVLNNLIGNALKFTSRGAVRVRAFGQDQSVCFEVEDEGIGIAPGDLEHIFERFWRGQSSGSHGVGLGLYIARRIVEAHGGSISVESTIHQGSVLSFRLPLS